MLERERGNRSPERRILIEEMANLIAAVGNHEGKAIAFSQLEKARGSSQSDMQKRFVASQGDKPIWKPNKYTLFRYGKSSFEPAGLVRKYIDPATKQLVIARTTYGEEQGLALAGLMLGLSEKYPKIPLGHVWGHTQSPSKNGPQEIRLKIFEAITALPLPIRQRHLATYLGEKDIAVGNHLRELDAHGIISYKPTRPNVPYRHYRFMEEVPSTQPLPYQDQPMLTQEVYNLFLTQPNRRWTRNELLDALIQMNPHRRDRDQKSLLGKVGLVVSELARQGFVEIEQPQVLLTKQQWLFLTDLIKTIRGFQEQDPSILAQERETAKAIVNDPARVLRLVGKAKEASTQTDQVPLDITKEQILTILEGRGELSVRELQELLFYSFRRRLVTQRLSNILNEMKREGAVTVAEKKKATYWIVADTRDGIGSLRLRYLHGRGFFERKIRITKLWRAGRHEEALSATKIRDAFQIYQLLEQQNPQLSYAEIGKRIGRKVASVDFVVARFRELGIPLTRDTLHRRRLIQSA